MSCAERQPNRGRGRMRDWGWSEAEQQRAEAAPCKMHVFYCLVVVESGYIFLIVMGEG